MIFFFCRTGGRVLITLGDQDIDLSPSFTIFLSTRDPTVEFPPDICSRVTIVNFTVTRSSLQSQCLNQVLKAERPDIDQKRSDLLKLQGEFQLRLRHLEKNLLQVLNEAKGRILDDDTVISSLETLKKEAAEVSKKVDETDEIMKEIELTSQQYMPLSMACSGIYFTIDNLHQVHYLYQYSLQFFLDIFTNLLHPSTNPELNNIKDYAERLRKITRDLFESSFNRVTRGMLHDDRIIFGLLLSKIYLKNKLDLDPEFNYLIRGQDLDPRDKVQAAIESLRDKFAYFKDLPPSLSQDSDFAAWMASSTPEDQVHIGV